MSRTGGSTKSASSRSGRKALVPAEVEAADSDLGCFVDRVVSIDCVAPKLDKFPREGFHSKGVCVCHGRDAWGGVTAAVKASLTRTTISIASPYLP